MANQTQLTIEHRLSAVEAALTRSEQWNVCACGHHGSAHDGATNACLTCECPHFSTRRSASPAHLEQEVPAQARDDIRALCDYAKRAAQEIETGRDWGGSPLGRLDEEGKLLDRKLLARIRKSIEPAATGEGVAPMCECGHLQSSHDEEKCHGQTMTYAATCPCPLFVPAPPAPDPVGPEHSMWISVEDRAVLKRIVRYLDRDEVYGPLPRGQWYRDYNALTRMAGGTS